jgi:hypothetical protein
MFEPKWIRQLDAFPYDLKTSDEEQEQGLTQVQSLEGVS